MENDTVKKGSVPESHSPYQQGVYPNSTKQIKTTKTKQ
jgi:hypothetical protein